MRTDPKHNLGNKKFITSGFTLIEILLVVLIISIMSAVGANIINSQSAERQIMNQADKFITDVEFLCDKAVLENRAFGIEWLTHGYEVYQYQPPEWQLIDTAVSVDYELNPSFQADLIIDGVTQILNAEGEQLPHIVCQPDGTVNAFEMRFSQLNTGLNDLDKSYYQLKTATPWKLTGGWYQPQ